MENRFIGFLVLFIFERAFAAGKISLKCTPEFCDEYVLKFPCPPLDPICSNPEKSLVIPSPTVCNCCEHCFIFQGNPGQCLEKHGDDLGEDCALGQPGSALPKFMCKPGTICKDGKCVNMTTPDPDFYPGYECKDGKCECTVIENNKVKKIFGKFDETEKTKEEQQCGCSISAYNAGKAISGLLPTPDAFLPIARCLPNGQYDPLQCIDNRCGCVNGTTGEWDTSVHKVLISSLGPNNPKCYEPGRHKPGQYYTKCEKERNDLMQDLTWEDLGEINILLSHIIQCTPDGEYVTQTTAN